MPPPVFFIVGPTASGKSTFAFEVARRCGAEIIGADAFQVYAGLDQLTAKPSPEQLAEVPHHLIGEIPLQQHFDVGCFHREAELRLAQVAARFRPAIVVGGTGLYIRSLTHGLAQLPPADPAIRAELEHLPLADLQARVLALDPQAALSIDLLNPRRLIRAIELCILTKSPIASLHQEWQRPPIRHHGLFLQPTRDCLYKNINQRSEMMFENGIIQEVTNCGPIGPTASQAIGVRQIQSFLAGQLSKAECLTQIQQATRHYAKRQLTWFRRPPAFPSFSPESAILPLAQKIANELQSGKISSAFAANL